MALESRRRGVGVDPHAAEFPKNTGEANSADPGRRELLVGLTAALAFPGCARLGSGDTRGTSVTGLEIVRRLKFDVPNFAHYMAWSHDGQRLALGGLLDKRLSVWDVKTGDRLPAPGDQIGGTHGLAYSPDGRYLAVVRAPIAAAGGGQRRYTVSLWDAQTGGLVRNLVETDPAEISEIEARSIAFSADGHYLAVAYGTQVALYALDSSGEVRRVSAIDIRVLRCTFRPDGTSLACLQWNRMALLTVLDGRLLDAFEGLALAVAWSPDGQLLARSREGIEVLDPTRRQVARTLSVEERAAYVTLSFSGDGRWLAAIGYKRLDLWDTRTWAHAVTLLAQAEHGQLFQSGGFSPKLSLLAVAGGNQATIWGARDY